jgi:MFS family permease
MVAFGAATGSIAGALVVLERGTTSLGVMSTTCKSVVVACTPLGALVGALLASVASRSGLGRRDSLLLNDLLYLLGAAAMALSSSFAWLTAGRFVVGLAVGVSTSVCTMYVSECAPARTRGRLAASAPLAGTVGILASYVLSLAVRSVHWFPYDPVGVVNADP